ncbi:hypothetical protein LCGC14_2669860, partial [marine sediment metagenome]
MSEDDVKKGDNPETPPQVETVPKSQYTKEKQGLLTDVTAKRERIRQLETENQQLKASQFQVDSEDLSEAEKKLYNMNEQLIKDRATLDKEKSEHAEERRKAQAKTLAS